MRIDAEKAGQAMLAFYLQTPHEAKAKKSVIFGEKYDKIFNDETTADKVLLAYDLLEFVEEKRNTLKKLIVKGDAAAVAKNYVLHATPHYLYAIYKLAEESAIPFEYSRVADLRNLYDDADALIAECVEQAFEDDPDNYTHARYFKASRSKDDLDEALKK